MVASWRHEGKTFLNMVNIAEMSIQIGIDDIELIIN
jgi:hypothetical protein